MKRKEPNFKYESVLLIDDNDLDNFINEKTIEGHLFAKTIYKNTSAQSAIEFLRNILTLNDKTNVEYPKIIFVDINMPMIDGFQFIKIFKKDFESALDHPKLVVLTSSLSEDDELKSHEISKEIIYLKKPLTPKMLDGILS